MAAAVTAALLIFADFIAGAFGGADGAEMVALASRGLRIYAVSVIFYGFNVAFINYTQGMRRMGLSNIVCFLINFPFVVLPALALFPESSPPSILTVETRFIPFTVVPLDAA